MAAIVELQMPIDGEYQPALSIPVETCQRFSVHPLRWLRYVGFTIYGIEGHISQSDAGPVVQYSEVDIQAGVYYYIPDSKGKASKDLSMLNAHSMSDPCLLDPDLMDDRTSYSSSISTRRADFAQRVTDRDGTCLMTGVTSNFQACHIIPHAKGSQYMNNLADRRNELLDPPLDDINDPRNGILLSVLLHRPFGTSVVAFLRTPNFAMSANDVAVVMQLEPLAKHLGFDPSLAVSRLTFQHFNAPDVATATIAPHNSDARQGMGHDDWPPPLLFDVAYGCAALNTWGVPQFVNLARQRTRHIYYDVDASGVDQQRRQRELDRAAAREKKKQAADSQTPDVADMILGLWTHNARKGQRKARAMKAEKTQEKVQTWLDSTTD